MPFVSSEALLMKLWFADFPLLFLAVCATWIYGGSRVRFMALTLSPRLIWCSEQLFLQCFQFRTADIAELAQGVLVHGDPGL